MINLNCVIYFWKVFEGNSRQKSLKFKWLRKWIRDSFFEYTNTISDPLNFKDPLSPQWQKIFQTRSNNNNWSIPLHDPPQSGSSAAPLLYTIILCTKMPNNITKIGKLEYSKKSITKNKIKVYNMSYMLLLIIKSLGTLGASAFFTHQICGPYDVVNVPTPTYWIFSGHSRSTRIYIANIRKYQKISEIWARKAKEKKRKERKKKL